MKNMREQKGVAAVELALILPILLLIIFGIIEFGLLMYNKQVLTNASREGARAGIVQAVTRPTVTQIQNVVKTYAEDQLISFGGPGLKTFKIETKNPASPVGTACTAFSQDLIVSVTYQYQFLVFPNIVKLLKGTFSNTIDLTAVTDMKCE